MGGRGGVSSSGRYGLPNGARAMTVSFSKGHRETLYQEHGMVFKSDKIGTTIGTPIKTSGIKTGGNSISAIYKKAQKLGYEVTLHSARAVKTANAAYKKDGEAASKTVAASDAKGTQLRKKDRRIG